MADDTGWTVADAKTHLSEVIERARSHGPQTITSEGRVEAVVVSADEWERKLQRKGSLAEFFANSPLRGAQLDLERSQEQPRDLEL